MSTEDQRRRSGRHVPTEDIKPVIKSSYTGRKDPASNEKMEIVWYDAETWEETTDGIRKLMKLIESRMEALETKMNQLLEKYEECAKLKKMLAKPNR